MTPQELEQIGTALFGGQWQTPLARSLGMNDAALVRKFLSGARNIPEHTARRIRAMRNLDEFIVGDAPSGKEYIIHTLPPRFIATVHVAGMDDHIGTDDIGGLTYACADDESVLCEFIWWDKPATGQDLQELLRRAELALLDAALAAGA